MPDYIELKEGLKHAPKDADIILSPDTVPDVGYVLTKNDLIIDIDCLSHEAIQDMIKRFDIRNTESPIEAATYTTKNQHDSPKLTKFAR